MKIRGFPLFCLLVVAHAHSCSSLAGEIRYTLTDLGDISGTDSRALGISNNGTVVGWAYPNHSETNQAFVYHHTEHEQRNIEILFGSGYTSAAAGINSGGTIVGNSVFEDGSVRATQWNHKKHTERLLGPKNTNSQASAISDNGFVTGQFLSPNGWRAFRFQSNNENEYFEDLGTLGGTMSTGTSINSNGAVVGYSLIEISSGEWVERGFIATLGNNMHHLETLGGIHGRALSINNSGSIVGTVSNILGKSEACVYLNNSGNIDGPIGLGVSTDFASAALDINERNDIVGWYTTSDEGAHTHRASLLSLDTTTNTYERQDLNNFIDPLSGWTLVHANAINDFGWIVGFGIDPSGVDRGFLLTPIPVPGTALVFPCVLTVFTRSLRTRKHL